MYIYDQQIISAMVWIYTPPHPLLNLLLHSSWLVSPLLKKPEGTIVFITVCLSVILSYLDLSKRNFFHYDMRIDLKLAV